MEGIADILFVLRNKGVRIWTDGEQLRYRAQPGVLTSVDLETIRAHKSRIIEFLSRHHSVAAMIPLVEPRSKTEPVPLTFTQQYIWNQLKLERRYSRRIVASAIRLRGPLSVEHLRRSLSEIVRRHEALRTRIVTESGIPSQKIDEATEFDLQVIELTALARNPAEAEARRIAEEFVETPVLVAEGPVFAARLLCLSDCDYVLVIAIDHMVSDGASLGIVLQEVFSVYGQLAQGLPPTLPDVGIQFADYAVWLRGWSAVCAEATHVAYWKKRLAGAQRLRLFANEQLAQPDLPKSHFATHPIQLGANLSAALSNTSQRAKTTLAMVVFAAYAATLFRWCNGRDLVLPFLTMGRGVPGIRNTVGCFGHSLFLRLELNERDTFPDLLARIVMEYGTAYEHDDAGRVAAELPTPEFVWNPSFNWFPKGFYMEPAETIANSGSKDHKGITQQKFEITTRSDMYWENELVVRLWEAGSGIQGAISYRVDRAAAQTIRVFEKRFIFFTEKIVSNTKSAIVSLADA